MTQSTDDAEGEGTWRAGLTDVVIDCQPSFSATQESKLTPPPSPPPEVDPDDVRFSTNSSIPTVTRRASLQLGRRSVCWRSKAFGAFVATGMEGAKKCILVVGIPVLILFVAAWQYLRPDRRVEDGPGTERLVPMLFAASICIMAIFALLWSEYWTRWRDDTGGKFFLYRHWLGLHKEVIGKADLGIFLLITAAVSGAATVGFVVWYRFSNDDVAEQLALSGDDEEWLILTQFYLSAIALVVRGVLGASIRPPMFARPVRQLHSLGC